MIRRKANNMHSLDIFGLSAVSQRVLLDIIGHGLSTVVEIAGRLNLPKSTVYDAVIPLLDQSLINEYSDNRGKAFGVSDKEQIARAHAKKIAELQSAQASLLSFITQEGGTDSDTVARPKIKFYAGTLGIKQAFRDMPWQKEYRETHMLWPTKDMIDIDEDFFRWHGQQRFKYGVIINAVAVNSDRSLQTKKHEWLKNDLKTNLVRVRYLPKGVKCKMSFWIYGNKCLFASGGKEKIAFVVHSKEFSEMMMLLWRSVWEGAEE